MKLPFSLFEPTKMIPISTARSKSGKENFDKICEVFGEGYMGSAKLICHDFLNGRTQLPDKPHSGRPSDSVLVIENVQVCNRQDTNFGNMFSIIVTRL